MEKTTWSGAITEDRESLKIPLRWRKPRKIFVNSMSDLFHEKVSDEFIFEVWKIMKATPQHNYRILTKRPSRMRHIINKKIGAPLSNVWLGTSVESSEFVNRIDELRETLASIRFISFEPLIASVGKVNLENIHWAIVGGESGRCARPIKERWIDEHCCPVN